VNIYVGNLPFSATEAELKSLFGAHGQVDSVAIVTDKDGGRSRGFGFVEMPSEPGAAALLALDGAQMDGRPLKVSEARVRETRTSSYGGSSGGFGGGGFRSGGRSSGGGGGRRR
jgi:RNA recognition motif-containing protein